MKMHSYIETHHFKPKTNYQPLEALIPQIEQTMSDQNVVSIIGEENLPAFKEDIIQCMEVYYELVGIDEEVIAGKGTVEPRGVLPRYTESLIGYFQELEKQVPADKEITILEYSGVDTIKIRYKYTDSVIKKLVKLGLRNPTFLEEPLKIFLKGGALHDLIGMLFVCSYPYEKEWVARTLYNFFEYDNRTDDHLLYGFYTVEKKSGYRGLHCDHTLFNPRFDADISRKNDTFPVDPNAIFTLLDPQDKSVDVLRKLKEYFNVEIQLHTTFESLWSSMEHTNNYNIQAKGSGRNSKITVQWKLLSDAMKNIEKQFERLQIDTEQARFEVLHHGGYIPVKALLDKLGSNTYRVHAASVKKVEDLEDLLNSHEISRQDYVYKLQTEASYIDDFAGKQNDLTVQTIFRMQSAFIYYGLANQREYFNADDIGQFVKKSLNCYADINTFLCSNSEIYKGDLLNIVAIFRYLYLGQKYGLGLMNPPKETFTDDDIPAVSYAKNLSSFETAILLLNRLGDEDMEYLKKDSATAIKIIHHYDILAREWELFNKESDSKESADMVRNIARFRERFINVSLHEQFNTLIESDKIKNIGFVVKFYTTLVWHGLLRPRDALKQIIKYSAYDKITESDLFYYELSAYRFLIIKRCESISDCDKDLAERHSDPVKIQHYKNYHRQNMIQLLFRIRKSESAYKFHKARLYFEQLTQTQFKIDHFSETIRKENE
jgi:ppGpp synthetase/RelA/SpoT-type nucleotidyltranferase